MENLGSASNPNKSVGAQLAQAEEEARHVEPDYDKPSIPADCWNESQEDYKVGGYHPVSVGEVYNGRYLIVSKLGWGHFSTVWLAVDTLSSPAAYFALKFQKGAREHSESCVENFTRPVSKDFNGVVSFVDYFEVSGPNGHHVCMVFEVLGPNILQLISLYEYKGVPIDVVRKIAAHSLIGLDYLHRICGVIHTDIKPENIVVSSSPIPMVGLSAGRGGGRGPALLELGRECQGGGRGVRPGRSGASLRRAGGLQGRGLRAVPGLERQGEAEAEEEDAEEEQAKAELSGGRAPHPREGRAGRGGPQGGRPSDSAFCEASPEAAAFGPDPLELLPDQVQLQEGGKQQHGPGQTGELQHALESGQPEPVSPDQAALPPPPVRGVPLPAVHCGGRAEVHASAPSHAVEQGLCGRV
ncbi:protein kinase-like protein [Cryptosporidium canis]|uniref:non-specific serine/threonine protein kinase n=1 Tax=Cryptosporidium canis TaxID=195482 RepID=A0ABQ8P433_9CRYT|nr:protein kinase-like protein [Cryptosporidium canis]